MRDLKEEGEAGGELPSVRVGWSIGCGWPQVRVDGLREESPPKLPLIGNLHQLASKTTLPHHRLAELPKRYGPIMHLQLGEIPIVVIPSPEMAKEVMRTHDLVLCSRPKMMMPEVVFYNCSDIALTPYGEYWRQVRKIATLELFATHRVQAFRPVKEEEVMDAIKSLVTQAKAGSVVNLSDIIFALNFNIILR
uniref:Uncharacterized protein n=1 Tax=Chenopodium quinoa TaxID=63459 RepID=A0A803MRV2_CHEQI